MAKNQSLIERTAAFFTGKQRKLQSSEIGDTLAEIRQRLSQIEERERSIQKKERDQALLTGGDGAVKALDDEMAALQAERQQLSARNKQLAQLREEALGHEAIAEAREYHSQARSICSEIEQAEQALAAARGKAESFIGSLEAAHRYAAGAAGQNEANKLLLDNGTAMKLAGATVDRDGRNAKVDQAQRAKAITAKRPNTGASNEPSAFEKPGLVG